jgi:hypothetical protein
MSWKYCSILPAGAEGNEHAAGSGANRRKGVRNAARTQDGFSRVQVQPLFAHLEGHFPLHHIEPFLLVEVHVQVRPARHHMLVFHEEERTAGFAAAHLEEKRAETQGMGMAKAVLCRPNHM